MSVYLDASVLVALFTNDSLSGRADKYLKKSVPVLIVGDFAAAEFASAIARRVRMRELTRAEAQIAFATFDSWIARAASRAETRASDISAAAAHIRRLDLPLRTPDALNIAVAERLGAELATFDDKMAAAARALGLAVAGM
ncbi:MAG TPA: type II toxin-antitoxin system VapC family toxin [Rhizomicrobium sp.]|nr:type II toxin-antitoxin system VapC family toxin [Rhizomicrobium sp.]